MDLLAFILAISAPGITDEQVQTALNAYIAEHPEAVTTVTDGSITKAKLHDDLADEIEQNTADVSGLKSAIDFLDDNALVEPDTEKSGFHDVSPTSVTFYPDSHLTGITAKYASSKNFVADKLVTIGTDNGITRTKFGQLIGLSGTGTGQFFVVKSTSSADIINAIKGKTFNIYYFIKKSTAWGNSSYIGIYDGVSYKAKKNFTNGGTELIGWTAVTGVTFDENASTFLIKFASLNGTEFSDGDCIWVGMYETELVDTEHVIIGDDPYTISVSGLNCIDTATHESTAKYVMPTKDYVDNHIPDIKAFWTEEIYALPEKFGAKGDGVADDSNAIAACIAYAKTHSKAIRGFNTYKVTDTIVLDGRYLDAYLKDIVYTGNNVAVDIQNTDIVFEFHSINSSAVGLSFGRLPDESRKAARCQVKGNLINSVGHCINVGDLTFYNTCEVRYLSSTNGNCINRNDGGENDGAGEYVFRSSSCNCPNGWVSYDITASKFYDFTIEGNCRYGLRNPFSCICIGFRHREQIDKVRLRIVYGEENNNGPLIKFTKLDKARLKYITDDPVFYCCIDVSEISGYAEVSSYDDWSKIKSNQSDTGIVVNSMESQNTETMGNKSYIIGGNLVLVPEYRISSVVDVSVLDFTDFDGRTDENIYDGYRLAKYLGTDYSLDVSHADIYFNSYFGAIGYNDLTITQSNGNTATIYDKLGNVIFDGTNEGNGKWRLQCIMDRESNGRYTGETSWWGYDGTNEIWEVTKIG